MQPQDIQNQFDSLLPGKATQSGTTRRSALKMALAVGYAASVTPAMAQSIITTSAEGLTTGEEIYDVAGSTVPFYYAAPYGKTDLPVLLVVHEIFGVSDYIKDVCRRFAKAGYLAIAPELYARQGDASKYTDIAKLMAEIVAKVPDEQLMEDLDGAVQWAGENGGNLDKVAITGFCRGGRTVWLYAEHSDKIKAAVTWYGQMTGGKSEFTPQQPVDLADRLKAPVLGLYGAQDTGITAAVIKEMKAALAKAGAKGNAAAKASKFVIYPGAGHAFHNDYRASYRKDAAQDGFKRALAWFKAKGVA